MLIIIAGAGRVGLDLARNLRGENRDVVLLDNSATAVKSAQSIDALVLHGDALDREKLKMAGIHRATVFIAATGSDERNLLTCAMARHEFSQNGDGGKELLTICRISDPDLLHEYRGGHLREWCGVDYAVMPIENSIRRLKTGLRVTSFDQVIPFGHQSYIVELGLTKDARDLAFSTLEQANSRVGGLPTIVGMKREGESSIIPTSDTQLLPKDQIAVAAIGIRSFPRIVRLMGHDEDDFPENPRVAVFGANHSGAKLAEAYIADGCEVTVIEPDLAVANALAGSAVGANSNLDVINGDHHDKVLLREVELPHHDIAVAALDDDHASIAVALMAQSLGVPRTGLILNDADLVSVVKRMGITFAVNKNRVCVDLILAKIHDALTGAYGVLETIPHIIGVGLEVKSGDERIGSTLDEIKLPSYCKVAFIQRLDPDGERVTLATNEERVLQEGDRIICFLPQDRVDDLRRRFSE